ncbi:MAG: hypothetical protein KatS3mg025_1825 [Bacteroidia bacterium]|nr:MAG: hypothetical protein KatS3mg025_1825 [Bacteroidia bacterium]
MIGLWVWLQLVWPIAGPITLTGSYGEIRGQTFHTGIDIAVGEKIGTVPVRAAGDGYVYRLRISHSGFGKVLYVRHPNGLVTVYGHLSHFGPCGEAIAQALQKAQNRFEVEKYLSPTDWPVKAGDTLAWAGNSGYSFGPHLHFEVRTSADKPLCPLYYLPRIPDAQPPVFFRVAVKPLGPFSRVAGRGERKNLRLRQVTHPSSKRLYRCSDTLPIQGNVGIEFAAGDRAGGGTAWLGLATISLYNEAGERLFHASWETLDFDWRRFLRWHIDYAAQQVFRIGYARLYRPPTESPPWTQGNGLITLAPHKIHTYRIIARDFAGNEAEVQLTLRGETPTATIAPRRPLSRQWRWSIEEGLLLSQEPLLLPWGDTVTPLHPILLAGRCPDKLVSLRGDTLQTHLKACLPPGHELKVALTPSCTLVLFRESLMDTLYCQARPIATPWGEGLWVGDPLIPLRFPAELRWKVLLSEKLIAKTYPLYRPEGSGVWSPVSGAQREGPLWRIPIRAFGYYAVMVDTFPPQIRALKAVGPYYLVSIEDLGSGVHPYALQVWAGSEKLFPEYYEPQRLLYLPRNKGRVFTIQATDRVGNTQKKTVRF